MTGSRPVNGSSMSRTSGSCRIAAMNWTFCWLPLRQLLGAPVGAVGDAEARRASRVRRAAWRVGRHAVQRGEVDELVEHGHARVEAALLGQVAPRPARQVRGRRAVPADLAGVGAQDPEADPHRRGLAGAVRARGSRRSRPRGTSKVSASRASVAREPLRDVVDLEGHAAEDSRGSRRAPPGPGVHAGHDARPRAARPWPVGPGSARRDRVRSVPQSGP